MKNQFNRNDPVHDEWWDNQETMTRRMLRSAQKINPQASLDETLAGSLNQSSITSAEMNITEEGILNDVGENSMSSLEFKKSVKFDPTLPQPWDEDTPLGRALRKVSVAAVHYDRNKDGVYINAFRGGAMTPKAFRLEMRRSLNIKLRDDEFNELLSEFDQDGDGTIVGSEFLVQFMSIGFREKGRIQHRRREKQRKKELADRMEERRRQVKEEEKMESNITAEFSKTDLQSALDKIQQVAGDYDATSASAMSLQGFLGTPLTPGNLRDMLRRTFNLRLSGAEIGAMMSAFDQDASGTLDGSEFLINFKKLGFRERSERAKRQRENSTAMNKHFDELEAKREAEKKKSSDNSFTFKYTSEDLQSALDALAGKSADYDPGSAAALKLTCFQGAKMTPKTFHDLCNTVFQTNFTPPQMGALMHEFDRDGDGTIDGSEFLVKFTQMGFEEKGNRFRRRKEFQERKKKKEADWHKKRADKKKAEEAKKVQIGSVSEDDWNSAMEKITAAAADYDKMSASAMSLQAFQGSAMHPPLFRDMIFRTFGVTLTPGEAGAVIKYFDKDGDGTVDGTEFLLLFTKLGFNEKTRRFNERKKEKERRDKKDKLWWEQREKEIQQNNANKVDRSFTSAHKDIALGKIAACAVDFDVDPIKQLALQAFQGSVMQPHVFKEMLKRTFELKLSPGELGAVISIFDRDGDGEVDGAEFLNQFFKIKHQERDRRANERREKQRRIEGKRQTIEEAVERERTKKLMEKTKFEANDRLSAMKKIKEEALRFDRTAANSMGLDAFQAGPPLGPDEFRKCLHKSFANRFTYPEIGALMTVFDKDADGTVDGAEFLSKFFLIAREEQKKLLPKKERPKSRAASPPKKKREKPQMVDIGIQAPDDMRPVSSPEKMPINYNNNMNNNVGTSNEDEEKREGEGRAVPEIPPYEPIAGKLKAQQRKKAAAEAQKRRDDGERPQTVGINKAGQSRLANKNVPRLERATTAPSGKKRAKDRGLKLKTPGKLKKRDMIFDEWEKKIEEDKAMKPVFFFPSLILSSPIAMPSLAGSKVL
ncbi:hypothetical protein TL16_g10998 [Triparma laevis f. inornata]|uniref:EF-hand domain-containing protein n=2 Tax=Triparma laevis TaxID=1534972 RepID=A0A9W7AAJ0_9STRA|nr:hypothetical protein TrLO_g8925 [Triparma laevis f. longispina]GMH87899.1 hypothetical protein TL16_g10998 [Triparma laevis f. inornata]